MEKVDRGHGEELGRRQTPALGFVDAPRGLTVLLLAAIAAD
jgi:hypothetical protein